MKQKWDIADGDPIYAETALLAAAVLRATRLEIQNRHKRHVFGFARETVVCERSLDTRWEQTWKLAQDGAPSVETRQVVEGIQDPDLTKNRALMTASAARKESHLMEVSAAALKGWPSLQLILQMLS